MPTIYSYYVYCTSLILLQTPHPPRPSPTHSPTYSSSPSLFVGQPSSAPQKMFNGRNESLDYLERSSSSTRGTHISSSSSSSTFPGSHNYEGKSVYVRDQAGGNKRYYNFEGKLGSMTKSGKWILQLEDGRKCEKYESDISFRPFKQIESFRKAPPDQREYAISCAFF